MDKEKEREREREGEREEEHALCLLCCLSFVLSLFLFLGLPYHQHSWHNRTARTGAIQSGRCTSMGGSTLKSAMVVCPLFSLILHSKHFSASLSTPTPFILCSFQHLPSTILPILSFLLSSSFPSVHLESTHSLSHIYSIISRP